MRLSILFVATVLVSGCDQKPSNLTEFNEDLREVLATKPAELGRPAALMKDGAGGPDWLATVHGYPNNREVCEEIVKPYNEDPELSVIPGTYYCEEIRPQT